jgi:hypothetical protein
VPADAFRPLQNVIDRPARAELVAAALGGWLVFTAVVRAGADRAVLSVPAVIGGIWRAALVWAGWMIGTQMVERPWGVAAYGAASVPAMPDQMRIRFKVVRLEQAPSQSFAHASDAVHGVREVLRRHGIPDRAVERSRLGLKSSWSYGAERRFLGYECQAAFAVESTDLDDVQQLLIEVVAAGANEIEGVDFDVTTKGELRAEARRQAVTAARNKAGLYAEAAGARLGPVLHIDDVDPEHTGFERYRAHGAGGEASAQDLAPAHVVVSAAVILGFSIIHD